MKTKKWNLILLGLILIPPHLTTAQFPDFPEVEPPQQDVVESLIDTVGGTIESVQSTLDDSFPVAGDAFEMLRDATGTRPVSDLYNASQALDNNECVPSFVTPASAMLPTGCADHAGCQGCYESNIQRLTVVRRSLERSRCIYNNTKRFSDAAISFGDNVSGIHGASGLAWQGQRRGIEKSLAEFEKAYDNKYAQLMESLQTALQGVNECEAQYGMRDWYQRFGLLYFEMMKEKYQRN